MCLVDEFSEHVDKDLTTLANEKSLHPTEFDMRFVASSWILPPVLSAEVIFARSSPASWDKDCL